MARALSSSYSRFDTHIFLKVSNDAKIEPLRRWQDGQIIHFIKRHISPQTRSELNSEDWILTQSMWSRASLGEQKSEQEKINHRSQKHIFTETMNTSCQLAALCCLYHSCDMSLVKSYISNVVRDISSWIHIWSSFRCGNKWDCT